MADFRDDVDFSDLSTIEFTKNIGGKTYLIREASGDAACKYRNALLKATKLGPDGKPVSIDGMADVEPLLVSLCMFEVTGPKGAEKYTPLSVAQVRAWPNRVQKYLFEKIKDVSELEEKETEEELEKQIAELQKKLDEVRESKAKNAQRSTTDGSA